MSVNTCAVKASELALSVALAACGGGGSGGGGSGIATADISTAAGALTAALPALQEAEIDYLADNPPPVGVARPVSLRSRWRPTIPTALRGKRGGAQAARTPMATYTEPCQDGGSTVYYGTTQKDVN